MRFKMIMCVIVFSLFHSAAIAQNSNDAFLQELYVKSGLEKQVAQFPLLMQTGFDQALAEDSRLSAMPESAIKDIRAAIVTIFSSEETKQIILDEFKLKLSGNDIEAVLEWLESPIGRQFTQLEESASTPEEYAEMQKFALQLQNSPPDPKRLEVMTGLDSALKASETGIETAMNMQLSIGIAIVSSLPKEQQPPYDTLVASIEQLRPGIEGMIREQTLISMLYTYRSSTQEDLVSYTSFASSPAGVKYHAATMSALEKVLVKGGYKLGEIISDIFKQSKERSDV